MAEEIVDAPIERTPQTVGRSLARPLQGAFEGVFRARPAGQHVDPLAVEGDDRHVVVRTEERQLGLELAQHAVAVDLDAEDLVDEDQIARPHRLTRLEGRHCRSVSRLRGDRLATPAPQ